MNIYLAVIFLLAGMALGLEVPDIAQRIVLYKCRKKNSVTAKDSRYTTALLKLGLFILNGSAWCLSGLLAEHFGAAILISFLFTTAILIAIIDLRIRIVPNELLLVMVAAGIAFQAVQFGHMAILTSILCMIAMIIFFTVVAGIVGFDKVGAGDVKLAGAMGLALGYPNIITALIIMSAVFFIYTFTGLMLKKLTLKSMLPFAPFMMTGMVFAMAYMFYS